jgi:hypothetical protein
MSVGDMMGKDDKPPYVTFHREAVEDKKASDEAGHYVARDVDYVHITPAYTKDVIIHKVSSWFPQMENNVAAGRIAPHWLDSYKRQYAAWKDGRELPTEGMPILGWGVISPAQQETLIRLNIRTVEDAAGMNADAIRMIGMGGMDIKNKAIAAVQASRDTGPLVMENARLKSRAEVAEKNVEDLTAALQELTAIVKGASAARQAPPQTTGIEASDVMPEEEPVRRGPGRPRKLEANA